MTLRLFTSLLTLPIRAYKYFLSPWLGQSCRFSPTCSSYAIAAIETHGPAQGLLLSVKRLCRCHPWCEGGYDPVPEATMQNNPATKNDRLQSKNDPLSSRCHTD